MPPTAHVLSANDRGHWATVVNPGGRGPRIKRHELISDLRGQAIIIARHVKMPPIGRAQIIAVWEPPDNRRLDPANLYLTAKAYVDGLVDAHVLPDDDSWHVTGPDMRTGWPRPLVGRMVLHITELPPLATFRCVSHRAAESVVAQARRTASGGTDPDHRAKASGRTVTVMYTDPRYPADLAGWALQHSHTAELAFPRS